MYKCLWACLALYGGPTEISLVCIAAKPVSSPLACVFYMGTQFSHLDYRVGMMGGKWGFHQMGLTPLREG